MINIIISFKFAESMIKIKRFKLFKNLFLPLFLSILVLNVRAQNTLSYRLKTIITFYIKTSRYC